MKKIEIYKRLQSDIIASKYDDIHLVNQENEINQFNTLEKTGWKNFIDGGCVIKCTPDYKAYYNFDFGYDKRIMTLNFLSYNGSAGINLLDFINSVINGDPTIFVKVDGLIIKDVRKYLFKIKNINIQSSTVDNLLIQNIKRYFPNLERIDFRNCIIDNNCNFNNLDISLKFSDCLVENIRSFNDCNSDIELSDSSIKKISPTTINSKKINIDSISQTDNIDLKKMFLICNFPLLTDFEIRKKYYDVESKSFNDSFIYMPYSAPNLEKILIEGKIESIEFLTKFKYLIDCDILCSSDDWGLFSTCITNKKEQERIFNRNKQAFEIYKIMHPNEKDDNVIGNLERSRIIKLSHFLSTIYYTVEEKDFYLKSNGNIIEYMLKDKVSSNVDTYYECYYDRLYHKRTINDSVFELGDGIKYKIIDNMLYSYNYSNPILVAKNFIYNLNGKPIIFCGGKKPVRTKEEAMQKSKKTSTISLEELSYNEYISFLKNYDSKEDISIGGLIDYANEAFDYHNVSGKDFLAFGEYGKKIYHLFEIHDRRCQSMYDIENKQKKYINLLTDLIIMFFDQFNISEKTYLYLHAFDYNLFKPLIDTKENKIYNIHIENEEDIFKTINNKTNGLYKKYIDRIKQTYIQYHIQENPYDMMIEAADIKKLTFSK